MSFSSNHHKIRPRAKFLHRDLTLCDVFSWQPAFRGSWAGRRLLGGCLGREEPQCLRDGIAQVFSGALELASEERP